MGAICDICGKEFKTTQGLRGHKTFVHGIKKLEESTTEQSVEKRVSELENVIKKLVVQISDIVETQEEFVKLFHQDADFLSRIIDVINDSKSEHFVNR